MPDTWQRALQVFHVSLRNLVTHRYLFNAYSAPLLSHPTNANIFSGAFILRVCVIYG